MLSVSRNDHWSVGLESLDRSVKTVTVTNAIVGATENAAVEDAGADRRGGKCRSGKCGSRLAAWKAEPILYSNTALTYFLKIVSRLLSE